MNRFFTRPEVIEAYRLPQHLVCAAEKLVGCLYTCGDFGENEKNCSRGFIMAKQRLTAEQEQEAKLLEAKIRAAVDTEIADLARLLVSKPENELFGDTEFQVRDLVLRVGAKAFQEHLRGKKTATSAHP